jgi:pyridoxine kinase
VLIDPVMGDDGKPYGPIRPELIRGMRLLIEHAKVITPNFTEACFLLEHEYSPKIDPGELKEWLVRLSDFGPSTVVITSVSLDRSEQSSSVVAYNREDGRFWKGDSLPIALDRAVQFVTLAIKASFGYPLPRREGIVLERVLGSLKAPLTSMTYEPVDW